MMPSAMRVALAKRERRREAENDLVVTAARTEEISEFTVLATEAAGCLMILEAAHTSDPALDAAMVLFKPVVQVGAGAVPDGLAQHAADRPRVGAMAVRRHPVRTEAHVARAERKNALAARMSRCSLSMASIRFPSRSIARYR